MEVPMAPADQLRARIMAEYEHNETTPDGREEEALDRACATADTIALLEADLEHDGPMATGAAGQMIVHPAIGELRQQRALLTRLINTLDFVGGRRRPCRLPHATRRTSGGTRDRAGAPDGQDAGQAIDSDETERVAMIRCNQLIARSSRTEMASTRPRDRRDGGRARRADQGAGSPQAARPSVSIVLDQFAAYVRNYRLPVLDSMRARNELANTFGEQSCASHQ